MNTPLVAKIEMRIKEILTEFSKKIPNGSLSTKMLKQGLQITTSEAIVTQALNNLLEKGEIEQELKGRRETWRIGNIKYPE